MPDQCGRSKVIGQTLFLGASVVSVNINLGWGDSASSATIDLIEDFQPVSCYQNNVPIDPFLPNVRNYADNHYYTCCQGITNFDCPDNCYIDELGQPYNSNRTDSAGKPNPPKEKNVPGKIYYAWTSSGVVSRYWYQEDPGFFGTGTRVNPDGTLSATKTNVYNLINVPVFFKFDNLTFTGIIKSWDTNFNNGRNYYRIDIESVSSLLRNSWMIVDGYAGAVFSYAPGATYGAPRNFTGEGLNSVGTIRSGNIHNLFNVYGFLESLGPYGFGGSNKNDNGISYRNLIQGLKVLTSSRNVGDLYWKSKNMFSPFGRILGKTMQKVNSAGYETIVPAFANYAFGVIPPRNDSNNIPRVEFVLDLSELNMPPEDIRYETSSKVVKISEFLQNLVEKNGQQTYWISSTSLVDNGLPYNVIKVKAVDRTKYSRPYTISSVVTDLQNSGFNVSTSSSGQSRNDDAKVRTVYFGGNQQRLYQAKNYRLAFNQSNYIWDPVNRRFINFRRFDALEKDKTKIPLGLSTRNPSVSISLLNNYHNIVDSDSIIRQLITGTSFNTADNVWDDDILKSNDVSCVKVWRTRDFAVDKNTGMPISGINTSAGSATSVYSIVGDYEVSFTNNTNPYISPLDKLPKPTTSSRTDPIAYPGSTQGSTPPPAPPPTSPSPGSPPPPPPSPPSPSGVVDQSQRFIPLFKDVICPFFGFKYERSFPITSDSNIHRNIRPVWMDTWTGQICASFDIIEAPPVSCGAMVSLYNNDVFTNSKSGPTDNNRTGGTTDPASTTSAGTSTTVPNNPTVFASGVQSSSLGIRSNSSYEGLGFLVTETEMRAAMAGWESYLQYCLAKMPTTKPDLYLMLINCWKNKGITLSGAMNTIFTDTNRQGGTVGPGDLDSGPEHQVGSISVAGSLGQPSKPASGQDSKIANIDFTMLMHPSFIQDLKIIVNFIKELGNKYYGRQYMVKLPTLLSYRDQQYSGISIPGFSAGNIFVFSGSGKLFYNYDPVEGAWEEWGNYIDNEIIVGGPHHKILSNDKGLIYPILGFNVSDKVDYVRKTWCVLTAFDKAKELSRLRQKAVESITNQLNSFGDLFQVDRPNSGSLAQWTIRVRVFKDPNVGEEPGTGTGEQGSNIEFVVLDGSETDEYLKITIGLSDDQLAKFKEFQELKRQAAAVYASMPAGLECGAEEELVETQTTADYACTAGSLPPDKSIDDWYIDTGAHYPSPNVPCPIVSRDDSNYRSPQYKSTTTTINSVTTVYANDSAFLIPSIDYSVLNGDGTDYTIVNTAPFNDAWGSGVCGGGKKLYMKSNWDNNSRIAFGYPEYLSDPRAIISISKYIPHSKTSLAYLQDPNELVMPNVAAEDISYYRNAAAAGNTYLIEKNGTRTFVGTGIALSPNEYDHLEYLEAKFLTPVIAPGLLLNPGSTSNTTANHRKIAPKAIQPFFAAIPLKSNKYNYGPWTNYPDLSKSAVFSYVNNPDSIVENLTDAIDVKYNPEYVPWNYGGVSFLDKAVMYDIESNENYQIIQEKGSVRMAGPPMFTAGGHFASGLSNALNAPLNVNFENVTVYDYPEQTSSYNSYSYNIINVTDIDNSVYGGYPIIQGISISVGSEGTNTTYNLGTYNPKHGIYNKERIDQMRSLVKNINDLDSKLSIAINKSNEQLRNQIYDMVTDTERFGKTTSASDMQPESIFGNSPTELLIGQARYFLPDINSASSGYLTSLSSSNIASGIMGRSRHETWAGLFTADESGPELVRDFTNKAAMSLDGIFSPISFYPTNYDATYSLSNYYSARYLISNSGEQNDFTCPVCQNTRVVKDKYVDYSASSRPLSEVSYPCPACTRSRLSIIKGSGIPKDSVPRVVIDPKSKSPEINFYTLNPIVVSAGEFRNWNSPSNLPSTADGVNDKHSIRVVGRGEFVPGADKNLDTTRNLTYSEDIVNPDYEAYDYEATQVYGTGLFPLNQRFFGFRGPMMLHGWGYDTDGYPIPNLYDDPFSIDSYGRYFRFQLDNNGFNDLTKPGLYVVPNNSNAIKLGDIITKRYEFKNNKWVRKSTPSKYFGTNWASKPNTWPVGPIDLRWDHSRRVWSGSGGCGEEKLPPYIISNATDSETLVEYLNTKPKSSCPYKMVYITLEQDLTRPNNLYYYSNAIRGYIDDLEYKSDPLPLGFRRLVYLIDRSGYTAPAGSRLYCKYNPDLGFYEPISKPTIITTGVIIGSQARIDLIYAKGRLSNNIPNTVVNFANPLSFYVAENSRGIFSYIDGTWTLTAVN